MNEASSKKGLLVILSGPSGSGKDTILRELRLLDPDIRESVSATTRSPRQNETDGLNYHFLSEEEFAEKIKNGEFIEYVKYNNHYYGTLKSEVEALISGGKTAVLVIEVRGAAEVLKKFPEAVSIFLTAPSPEALEARLRIRAQNSEAGIKKRLLIAEEEIERRFDYEYVVVNDVLADAVSEIYNIIKQKRNDEII